MNTNAEIETIVRRVLNRMLAGGSSSALESTSIAAESSSILRLQHQLITLASIPRDLTGIREVHIPTRAVVTPAVRDLLRNASASIIRGNATKTNSAKPDQPADFVSKASPTSLKLHPSLQPLIITGSANFMPAIMRTICSRQAKTLPPSQDDAAALREATVGIRNGHRAAVIIGSSAHAIAWQAARDEKLRPVVVGHWTQLAETLAEVPTNLVILSTKYWNAPAACNVIRAFYQHLTQS